jgi:hypothetical protein
MSRADRIAARAIELRHVSRADVIALAARLEAEVEALRRGVVRCRAGWKAARAWAELCERVAFESGELLAIAGRELGAVRTELQHTAEQLTAAREAATPREPPPEPHDARHWREKCDAQKSELRRLRALVEVLRSRRA